MITLRNSAEIESVPNLAIRLLLDRRIQQMSSPDIPGVPEASFIVVEGGDAVSEIEQVAGFPMLTSLFDEIPFGHPDFYPCFEFLEEHHHDQQCIYEMVFIGNDDGAATAIFVPDEEGVDPDLLAMCRSFATPAVSTP